MARVEIDAVVRHANGVAAEGKEVLVYERGTTNIVTLYTAETGPGVTSNPTTTDALGHINAWVHEGSYDLVVDGIVRAWEAYRGPALPIGAGLMWFTGTPPAGFLLADGSQVSQTTYADLYALLSTTYNIGGEAAGQFRLPDLRSRVGAGHDAGQAEFDTLGETGGAKAITLTGAQSGVAAHGHGFTQPSVTVSANQVATTAGGGSLNRLTAFSSSGNNSGNFGASGGSVTNAPAADASQAHSNLQPFLVVNYIVKY